MSAWTFDRLVPSPGVWTFDRLVDVAGTPTITSVGTVRDGTAITITGTGFSASGNSLFIIQADNTIQVPVNTEGATSFVSVALDTSGLYLTQPVSIYLTNSSGVASNAVMATILPASGKSATVITQSFLGDASSRGSASPDISFTDEIRVQNVVGGTISDVTVTGQGAFIAATAVTAFDYAVQDGTGLGDFATATWANPVSTASVPSIISLTLAQAIAAIQAAGLVAAQIASQQSTTVAKDLVAAQFPTATTVVTLGTTVEITLSLGGTGTIVPIFLGMTHAQAELARQQAGLTGSSFRIIDGLNTDLVLNQSVAPGTVLSVGDSVDIAYSSNKVPGVIGQIVQDGEAILLAAGLLVGEKPPGFDSTAPIDTILSQDPVEDTVVSPGATVFVTLSLGAPPASPGATPLRRRINHVYDQ